MLEEMKDYEIIFMALLATKEDEIQRKIEGDPKIFA